MPEYAVLDKDTLKSEIMPCLSIAERGFTSKFDIVEIVNAILCKLKSGCRWRFFLSDNQEIPIAMAEPQAGNHADLFEIEDRID